MNFKKILALLMAMLFIAFALVGCKKDTDVTEETLPVEDTVVEAIDPDDLKNYTVIRSSSAGKEVANACSLLAKKLKELTGSSKGVRNDDNIEASEEACEILVGTTNRQESIDAIDAFKDFGYSISTSGNKIIIIASNDMIISDAVNFFMNKLKKLDDGTCEYVVEYQSTDYQEIELVSSKGKANYNIVFTDFYNNLNQHTDKCNETIGFTQSKAKELSQKLEEITGVKFGYFDEKKISKTTKEIIIGKLDGDTNHYFDYHENGIYVKDGDIYIYGHNQDGIASALNNFIARLEKYNSVVSQKKFNILCNEKGFKWSKEELNHGAPLPKGLKYEGAYTAASNGVYFVYDQAAKTDFTDYTKLLEKEGYEKYFDRNADGNLFAGYNKGDDGIWVYYIASRKELRIIFEDYQPLPEFSAESTGVTASITMMGVTMNEETGLGMVITLENGNYVIIDGNTGNNRSKLAERYYNYLKDNNKRSDGKIVIEAWIITHGHSDHYRNFETFGQNYGDKVECKYIIYNLPSVLTVYGAGNSDHYFLQNHEKISKQFKGATVYTVHTGYAATFGGVFVEFMATYEDLYNNNDLVSYPSDPATPHSVDEFNDTCLDFRLIFNEGKADEAGVFILADSYFAQGERLASMWSDSYMTTTVVQMAHHGYGNGVTSQQAYSKGGITGKPIISTTYSKIKATYAFCPGPENRVNNSEPIRIMREANPALTLANVYTSEVGGKPRYVTMTFNGGVKVATAFVS